MDGLYCFCVENMAVTVIQQNDGRLTEQEKKIVRFAERLPPYDRPPEYGSNIQ
jgi:hypothetical protein